MLASLCKVVFLMDRGTEELTSGVFVEVLESYFLLSHLTEQPLPLQLMSLLCLEGLQLWKFHFHMIITSVGSTSSLARMAMFSVTWEYMARGKRFPVPNLMLFMDSFLTFLRSWLVLLMHDFRFSLLYVTDSSAFKTRTNKLIIVV